jgi:diguanylate cyclase (GGDEF)-like protein
MKRQLHARLAARLRALLWVALALALAPRLGVATQISYRADVPVSGPSQVQFYKDSGRTLDLAAVTALDARFAPVAGKTADFGFSSAAYWLRLNLESKATAPTTVFLSIAQPTLDEVRLYVLEGGLLRQTARAGDRIPAAERSISADHPVLPITIEPGKHYQLYLRIAGTMGALMAPIELQSAADVEHEARRSLMFNGIVAGALGAIVIYNLFIYLLLRDRIYLFYVAFMLTGYMCCTALNGFGAWMLYPQFTWPANQGLAVFACAEFLLIAQFTRLLLETAAIAWVDRTLLGIVVAGLVGLLSSLLLPEIWVYRLIFVLMLFGPPVSVLAGVISLRRGHPQARLFLWSRAVGWAGVCGYGLTIAGVINLGSLARSGITVGVVIGCLLLSLALADRIRALQAAARRAEDATRHALQFRQDELERTVEMRTRELDQARRHAEYLATMDSQTDVFNRRGLMPLLQRAIEQAQQHGTSLSIISFDIDHFKRINDEFGHAEGDRVLLQVAALTRSVMGAADLLGRTGGEEFMIVMHAAREPAAELAERLRSQIDANLRAGTRYRVTASFGIAALSPVLWTLDTLQRAADAALYRAKNRGRNCVEIYDETSNATTRTRAIMLSLRYP